MSTVCTLFVFLAFLYAPTITAQQADVLTIAMPSVGIAIQHPVSISVESPSLELETALIIWKLDEKEIDRGIGAIESSVTVEDTSPHNLSVTVVEHTGITRSASTLIQASGVDLLWEADTLTPPQYRGRALPTTESVLSAEALIFGEKDTSPLTHIYTWKMNGRALGTESGIGKNALKVPMPMFENSVLLQVTVRGLRGNYVGQTSVKIATVNPRIIFYEKRPLLGVWTNTTLNLNTLTGEDLTVSAFPYFFSGQSVDDPTLTYEWTAPPRNGQSQRAESSKPFEIAVTAGDPFSLRVLHKKKLLQEARATGVVPITQNESGASVFEINK